MNKYTKSIDEVIHYLSKLPSIGRKSATKMALKILEMDDDFTIEFAKSLINMKKRKEVVTTFFPLCISYRYVIILMLRLSRCMEGNRIYYFPFLLFPVGNTCVSVVPL